MDLLYVEAKRYWDQRHGNKAQDTARPRNTEIMEHRVHKQGKDCSEHGSQKRVGGHCARRILLECIDEVIQGCLEDCEEPKAHEEEAHDRSEPEDVFARRPSEDKQPSSEKHGSSHHGREAGLWNGFVAILFEFPGIEFVVSSIISNALRGRRSRLTEY